VAHRISINTVDVGDRQALVNLMLQYLTDDIVDDHMNIIHSGIDFFTGHRAYIGAMEAWLAANAGAQFVPLPEWIPTDPIPAEFNVVRDEDNGTPRPPLQNLNPNVPVPAEIAPGQLCSFQTGDDLANAINGWHGGVHGAIGGSMGSFMLAAAAPIFWCWHSFLDDVYYDWEACEVTDGNGDRTYGHKQPDPDEYERYKRTCDERKAHYHEHPLEFDERYLLPLYGAPVPAYQSAG
jgi:hypothetical protein